MVVRLDLPPRARLHDVFHVGLLKSFMGTPPAAPPPLLALQHGAAVPEPWFTVYLLGIRPGVDGAMLQGIFKKFTVYLLGI